MQNDCSRKYIHILNLRKQLEADTQKTEVNTEINQNTRYEIYTFKSNPLTWVTLSLSTQLALQA